MPRKARALDLRAAIAAPEKEDEVSNITFAQLCGAYVAVVFDGADLRVRKWVEAFGSTSAWEVRRDMLERCVEAMQAAGYKSSTINRDISQIGSIYKWAKARRMAPKGFRSPTLDIPRLEEALRVVHLSDAECRSLLAGSFAARDCRFPAFVHLLHDTGARYSELIERRWADIDPDRRTILCQTTKTGRPRVLFFTGSTADLVRKTWTRREPEALLFEGRLPGVPIRYRAAWRELVAGIGRPDLRMHDLRHVAAQRLLRGGVTVGVASQILGHSSNILQKRYGHLETGALQDAALSVLGE
jgi:site-specific recombinase XerD